MGLGLGVGEGVHLEGGRGFLAFGLLQDLLIPRIPQRIIRLSPLLHNLGRATRHAILIQVGGDEAGGDGVLFGLEEALVALVGLFGWLGRLLAVHAAAGGDRHNSHTTGITHLRRLNRPLLNLHRWQLTRRVKMLTRRLQRTYRTPTLINEVSLHAQFILDFEVVDALSF